LRIEVGEHVELRVERARGVQIEAVFAHPAEGLAARDALQILGADPALVKDGFVFGGEIVADDGDDAHVGEERGRYREVRDGSPQAALARAERRGDGINGYRADD
jgi:hypothetical protein